MAKIDIKTKVLGPISTNTYILRKDNRPVIIDPGFYADEIIKELDGLAPAAILLTHGHFDHIMAVQDLRKHFPGLKVYASENDREIMSHPGKEILRKEFDSKAVTEFDPVKEGDVLSIEGMKFTVMETPGHTKGGICYLLEEDGDEDRLFTGDTIFNGSYGRTDFYSGDFQELKDSILNKIFKRFEDRDHMVIYPGHEDATTLEHERLHNPIRMD